MKTLAEILHHLVDNSEAFTAQDAVDAHKTISEHFGEEDRHFMVPSPEAEKATSDEKAARIAQLRAELSNLEDPAPAAPPAE